MSRAHRSEQWLFFVHAALVKADVTACHMPHTSMCMYMYMHVICMHMYVYEYCHGHGHGQRAWAWTYGHVDMDMGRVAPPVRHS